VVQGGSFDSPIGDDWTYAELSCANTELSFENVERVVVEPISVGGTSLAELVRQAVDAKLKCPIEEREYSLPTNYSAIGELAKICDRFPMGLQDIPWPLPSAALPAAFADLPDHRKRRLCGWCRYFYFGTVQEVRREAELSEETDDRTICEICDPGDERPPALVNYSPWLAEDQERPRIDVGYCDWCNGLSIRCKKCGAVTAVPESSYEESLECEGGCGLRFVVSYDGNPAEGSAEIVEIVSDEQ
jgi:RNase P subunit RPR2